MRHSMRIYTDCLSNNGTHIRQSVPDILKNKLLFADERGNPLTSPLQIICHVATEPISFEPIILRIYLNLLILIKELGSAHIHTALTAFWETYARYTYGTYFKDRRTLE